MAGPAVTFLYSNCHLVLGSRGGRRKSKGLPTHPGLFCPALILSHYNMVSDKADLLTVERMK